MKNRCVIYLNNIKYKYVFNVVLLVIVGPMISCAQTIIGGTSGDSTALLDLQSNHKGLLLPRLTSDQRSLIVNPAEGLMIYNTTLGCLEINTGSAGTAEWTCLSGVAKVSSFNCSSTSSSGVLVAGIGVDEGVSSSISYSGGNNGSYGEQVVGSMGVTGLFAVLRPGKVNNGEGILTYSITGVPSEPGIASFDVGLGSQRCILQLLVVEDGPRIDCESISVVGTVVENIATSGVSISVSYMSGAAGMYQNQTAYSVGVIGLTASTSSGTYADGGGNLIFSVTGTPVGSGIASFQLELEEQICQVHIRVISSAACGAVVSSDGTWKEFMCHNLGANYATNPLVPSWELIGNYYQWGRNPNCFGRDGIDDANPCQTPVYGAAAPWGIFQSYDNLGGIVGWSTDFATNDSWSETFKTEVDPCPTGFRLPTKSDWDGVVNGSLNTRTYVGSWAASSTNYSSGVKLGTSLFLPSSGFRNANNGILSSRGEFGYYWSSSPSTNYNAWVMIFNSSNVYMNNYIRTNGFSVRCVSE